MFTIPLAFFIVMLELSIGSFLVLYALDARNDTSVNFVRFQAALYLVLFTLLTWATMQGFATPELLRSFGYRLDFAWLKWQTPTLLWFMLLQIPYNLLLYSKRTRIARLIVGGVVAALGLACLLAVGMGFRGVAAAHLGGAFTVLAFVAGALALGGVSTAMLLGHWYLNTPTASGKPLEFATTLTIAGITLQIALGLLAGPTTYLAPAPASPASGALPPTSLALAAPPRTGGLVIQTTTTPTPTPASAPTTRPVPPGVQFNTVTLIVLQYLVGLGLPLTLSGIALWLERGRSFQSATGMLYIAVVFAFFGEILARNLFLQPLGG